MEKKAIVNHAVRLRRRSKRGAYFFVIDAFIAASILTFTLVLIFSLFTSQRGTVQTYTYAQDYNNFLTKTLVRDYQHPIVLSLIAEGSINDTRRTLAEQLLHFYHDGKLANASSLLEATTQNFPYNVVLNVSIESATGERTGLYATGVPDDKKHSVHLVAKSLQYTLVEDPATNETVLYGPVTLNVEVWS